MREQDAATLRSVLAEATGTDHMAAAHLQRTVLLVLQPTRRNEARSAGLREADLLQARPCSNGREI